MKKLSLTILSVMMFYSFSASAEDLSKEALELLKPVDGDIIIGKADAPLTIVEYASMSCGHCAAFHANTLPFLEEKYISTGKLKLVFRHFPLNPQAVKGATLVECVDGIEKKQKFMKTLFKSIEKWAYTEDFQEKLKNIAKLGGVKAEKFDACMADKKIEEKILNGRLKASNLLKIESTPTIIFEGEKIRTNSNEELAKIIDSKL